MKKYIWLLSLMWLGMLPIQASLHMTEFQMYGAIRLRLM